MFSTHLNSSGNLQEGFGTPAGQSVSGQYDSSDDPRDDGRGGAAESAGVGDAAHNPGAQHWHFLAGCLEGLPAAQDQQVRFVLGNFFGSLALGLDFELVCPFHRDFEALIDHHAQCVSVKQPPSACVAGRGKHEMERRMELNEE